MSRRTLLRTAVGGAATAAMGAVLAACGSNASPTAAPAATTARPTIAATTGTSATTAASPATASGSVATTAPAGGATTAATAATGGNTGAIATAASPAAMAMQGFIPSPAPDKGVPDAYTQYPKPFKAIPNIPGKGSKWTALIISYETPPTPHDQNKYWQELEKRLGVSSYEPIIAPNADYEAKFNSVLASGDLPDTMFFSPPAGWQRVLLQGAFADLTPYLTGDALKDYPNLAKFPSVVWKNVALNKKIYGVPHLRPLANSNVFYFRQDWADKVGYPTQKNADDVFNMFVAFTKKDPDGNGKDDTFGLSSSSPRPNLGTGTLRGMFRAPNGWRLNPDGTLVRVWETPEWKQTLEFCRRLWEAGAYHPDALTNGTTQNKDLFFGGKIGGYEDGVTGMLGSGGASGSTKKFNPSANVRGWVPLVGYDGGKAVFHTSIGYFGWTAISARAGRDKERVKELLRILDWFAAPFGSEEQTFRTYGIEGLHYDVKNGVPTLNDKGRADKGPLDRFTSPPPVSFYDLPGESEYYQKFLNDVLNIGVDDPTWGYYSPTAAMKGGDLAQFEGDMMIDFIVGRRPLSDFDVWLKDWRARGGDQSRKEFQDAIKGA